MPRTPELDETFSKTCAKLGIKPTKHILRVRINDQKMDHFVEKQLIKTYEVSTGKNPPSCIEGSEGTPTGLHTVGDKIGEGAPSGMVFKGRVPTGQRYDEVSAEDQKRNLVTTRILRLRGLEDGKNAGPGRDTYDRFVYIHGTNHEDRIGSPDTAGCVALRNAEVIELYELVEPLSLVWIEE